jgi:hypothetical protein
MIVPLMNCQTPFAWALSRASRVISRPATAGRTGVPSFASNAARSAARSISPGPTPQEISSTRYVSSPVLRSFPWTMRSASAILSRSSSDNAPCSTASSSRS